MKSQNYDEKRNSFQGKHKIIPIESATKINLDQMKDFILGREGRKIFSREEWVDDSIQYNIFKMPSADFFNLYRHIRDTFYKKCDEIGINMTCQHYIHGWCNIFEKGDSIEWHSHCEKNLPNMYHGVFCVDPAGESFTEYRYNDTKKVYSSIKSVAGQGHFICDMITEHRSTQNESNKPRITIAFDIVDLSNYQKHWDTPNGNQFIPFIQ